MIMFSLCERRAVHKAIFEFRDKCVAELVEYRESAR